MSEWFDVNNICVSPHLLGGWESSGEKERRNMVQKDDKTKNL